MAGDRYDLSCRSWYKSAGQPFDNQVSPANPLSDILLKALMGLMTPQITGVSTHNATLAGQDLQGYLSPGINTFLTGQGTIYQPLSATKPKAYVNWVLLDEQFNRVEGPNGSGYEIVGASDEYKMHSFLNQPVVKSGYLYVWVSNETYNIDVFFDNLTLVHRTGPLLQEDDYYPFGLEMKMLGSRVASKNENKTTYSGKELQSAEFSDGTGLELYDFGARNYDPQIGRWHNIDNSADKYLSYSPYNYALNSPLNVVDPDGNDIYILIWFSKEGKNGSDPETGHAGIAVDNYKTQVKKDSNGNSILDKNGNPETEQVKDGTFTYYDLWPKDPVGDTELQTDVNSDYSQGIKINSLPDLMNIDPTTHRAGNVSAEGRAADGIVQLTTTAKQDDAAKNAAKTEIMAKTQYNACNNNCSSFVQNVLNAAIHPTLNLPFWEGILYSAKNPKVNASQVVTPGFPLNVMYDPANVVAPNNLYNAALQVKGAKNIKGPPNGVIALPYLKYYGK